MNTPGVLKSLGYELVDFLGKGSYGEVKLANSKRHQKKVAIKIMHRRLSPGFFVHKLLPRELLILKTARHPHIPQVHEIFEMPNGQVFVVMEAAATTLLDKIRDLGSVPIGQAKIWFSQLLSAVEYLHQQDIVHRDLKCKNILLTENNQIKLADFGLARFFKGPDLSETFFCTPECAPPEVLEETPYDAKKSDVWSLGVIFYAMVTGTMPFKGISLRALVKAQKKPLAFPNWISVDESCKNFIEYMLQLDPSARPTVTEVANHPWLQTNQEWCLENKSETSDEDLEEEDEQIYCILHRSSCLPSSTEECSGPIMIYPLKDSSGEDEADDDEEDDEEDDEDDQDGGTISSDSSSSDGEEIISAPEEEEVAEEEEEHGCLKFSPIRSAAKRVAAPILRASRTLHERMRKIFKIKSTAHSSSSTPETSSDVSDQSGLEMKPIESQKTKRQRFPKFKIPKKIKTVLPL
ncbi:testis-specific serine/threonine-protein kinase 6 isoform X1 [Astyanax mexicanus]|uniref:testis-specific serine/threonine-protein kinase 6 isoform X1 n=1 Tax=Astyanax mexicanus TaxID=7994 RepID=UPI0020CB69AB|nr:testis-specific serine/threonine-protein kinase 6 isoform X1 [Astyanax mexicanus]XP_049339857.1 testis-specific serine/threonine-protein kinase 6 isoform X1 [Astyanax mexicanus]XP_049339858.1 testis-specific serine/threonine-protein kinase 6 isoform X4 [Astyanax mexicanus]XP_049339860.1 testis-specific serine/threonine-protein kinase 6 isoform X1 [Astyanax mexicanus]